MTSTCIYIYIICWILQQDHKQRSHPSSHNFTQFQIIQSVLTVSAFCYPNWGLDVFGCSLTLCGSALWANAELVAPGILCFRSTRPSAHRCSPIDTALPALLEAWVANHHACCTRCWHTIGCDRVMCVEQRDDRRSTFNPESMNNPGEDPWRARGDPPTKNLRVTQSYFWFL